MVVVGVKTMPSDEDVIITVPVAPFTELTPMMEPVALLKVFTMFPVNCEILWDAKMMVPVVLTVMSVLDVYWRMFRNMLHEEVVTVNALAALVVATIENAKTGHCAPLIVVVAIPAAAADQLTPKGAVEDCVST